MNAEPGYTSRYWPLGFIGLMPETEHEISRGCSATEGKLTEMPTTVNFYSPNSEACLTPIIIIIIIIIIICISLLKLDRNKNRGSLV